MYISGNEKSKSVRIVVRDQQVTYSTTPVQEPASSINSALPNGHGAGIGETSSGLKGLHWAHSNGKIVNGNNGDISLTSTPTSVHITSMRRSDGDVKVSYTLLTSSLYITSMRTNDVDKKVSFSSIHFLLIYLHENE